MAAHGGRHSLGGRLGAPRSASPANRRTLALDMRRIANLLRDSPAPAALAADSSVNNSRCSTPHSAWEPADRSAMALGSAGPSPVAASRMIASNQVMATLSEKINQVAQRLQQQSEGDRRRLSQLERKLEASADDRARHGEQRERWAELQGKVDGLIEETQSLTRRVEGLDERLWTRTSGSEGARQRGRELEQQVQALEQQARLSAATSEETSKRQAAKLRRAEQAAEEAGRRLARLEEDVRGGMATVQRDRFLETRLGTLEQQQDQLDDLVRSLQAQIDEGLPGFAALGEDDDEACGPRMSEAGREVDDVLHAVEKSHSELEKKVMKQVEEQAAFRVKVDHQLSRVSTLADRLETAHEPALESLRSELASQRSQDRQLADGEVAALRRQIQESADGAEDALAEVREGLREVRALQGTSVHGPRHEEDGGALRGLRERLADLEQRAGSLEEAVSGGGVFGGDGGAAEGAIPAQDLEDLRSRLDWLEEQSAARAAERPEARHAAEAQDKMCRVLERLSCLEQQAPRGEVDRLHQQLQQLQDLVERRRAEDSSSARSTAEAEARVGAVSQQVALLAARLSEVEGGLDFARETTGADGASSAADVMSEAGGARPPLPRGEGAAAAAAAAAAATAEIQDRLVHVAEHLEAERSEISELSRRLEAAERQLAEGEPEASRGPGAGAEARLQGELGALSERLRGLEEGAELKVRCELEALSRRLRGLEEGSEPKGELEALSKRLLSLEGAKPPEDLSDLRGELSQLTKQVQDLQGQRVASPTASKELSSELQSELVEIRGKLEQLEEQLEEEVGSVREEVSEAKATAAELSGKVSEPRAKLEQLSEQLGSLKGDLAALSERQGALEDGADPRAKLEQLSEQLGSLKCDVAALSERQGALEEGAEPKGELEALSKRLLSLEGAKPPEDQSDLRGELSQLAREVQDLQGQRAASPAASKEEPSSELQSELDEIRGKLEQLEEELDSKVGSVREVASGAKAAAAELATEMQGHAKTLVGQPWNEALDGQRKTLEDLQSKLGGLETSSATLGGLQESMQEHAKEMDAMRGRVEVMEKQALSELFGELKGAHEKLRENVDSASVRVKGELETLCRRLDDLDVAAGPTKVESAEGDARDRQEALEEVARGSRASVAEAEAKLAARIQAVEEQLVSRSAGGGGGDAKARADVQEKVSDLTAQLAQELKDLAMHGEELRAAAGAAARRASPEGDETLRPQDVAAGAPRQDALESLAKEVAESGRRARAAEDALQGLRQELDQVRRSASPKVGIGIGGGVDDLRGRMDLLDKQVGELRVQLRGKATPLGHARGRSPAGEEPLDFSLTGASEQMRGTAAAPGEEPLDFSLTGDVERANLGDSLNFSLTGASKRDANALEPTPGGAAAESADSGGGARGVGIGGAAAGAASGGGARARPSPLKLEAEEKSVPLSPVQEGSTSDDRRRARAGSGRDAGQPQDALGALVAGAAGRSPSAASPAGAGPAAASPARSPASDRLAASVQSQPDPIGESMVSQSGMSVGADYSVEDSTELEKCDYFEAVEPGSLRGSPAASPSGPGDALDSILGGGRPRPAELKPVVGGVTPMSEAPRSAASTGTVIRHSPRSPDGASEAPAGGSSAGPPRDAGADDYEDESFDDDMSIPESIPAGGSSERSGSDEA